MLWELINPSDCYTFHAPNIEIAGCCAVLLSTSFGAKCIDGSTDESTPLLWGWKEWLADRGINDEYVTLHKAEIADALDSFLIGDASDRRDIEELLARLPEDERRKYRDERQDRKRSSTNQIGEVAYRLAEKLRART